jgi:hypothetical protein
MPAFNVPNTKPTFTEISYTKLRTIPVMPALAAGIQVLNPGQHKEAKAERIRLT